MPLTPGGTFERYEIQRLVGRGGMGEVWSAVDLRLHRPVALKVLRTDKASDEGEANAVARFLREARAAAALNHPNSVAIYELGEAEGIAYIAMEFVTGATLRKYIGDPGVSLETRVGWLVDAARALWAAHKAGLVHRDVKPGNVMVSDEGLVKVLDFGLAKAVAPLPGMPAFQTQMGQVLGTPRYMAPEQLEGAAADARSDQFSFGVTAYELLSGICPGGPTASIARPLDEIVPAISRELAAVIVKTMAYRPEDRFATMEEAAHALRASVASLRRLHGAASLAAFKAAEIEPPTRALAADEEVPASREIHVDVQLVGKGGTIPLAQPLSAALSQRLASGAPPMSRGTVPLPQAAPSLAPTSGTVPLGASSGVYATRAAAQRAAAAPDARGSRTALVALVVAAVVVALAIAAVVLFAVLR